MSTLLQWQTMEYAKLIAAVLTLVGAVLGLAFSYKLVVRSDDPARPEEQRLNRKGWLAMLLVIIAGMFSIYSEWQTQHKKTSDQQRLLVELQKTRQDLDSITGLSATLIRELQITASRMERPTSTDTAKTTAATPRSPAGWAGPVGDRQR